METSPFQGLKLQIVELLSLSKDAIHIHIGMSVFIVAVCVLSKGRITFKCLLPVFIVAAGMEAMDLYDDFNSLGYCRWGNSLHDFINTSLWPVIIVVLVTRLKKWRNTPN
ncbi:hypothetical protein [uncultured Paraglaciecola sp.]|uniref:hypothetical protein n=1 Tax=uncultured Paraglaciecola sp. TaxID=1765024 RepID=UPI0030D7A330|tara:strand:+ start:13198 stop:13527 length:330 start_codon:yes stop_codon:yes gene_type:complete